VEPDALERPLRAGRDRPGRRIALVSVLAGIVLGVLTGASIRATSSADAPPAVSTDTAVSTQPGQAAGDGPVEAGSDTPCSSSPEMCGAGAGSTTGACDDPAMCGDIAPAPGSEPVDAGSGPCQGQLCGEIGPGLDDGTGP
jgi:hypothetical protein